MEKINQLQKLLFNKFRRKYNCIIRIRHDHVHDVIYVKSTISPLALNLR